MSSVDTPSINGTVVLIVYMYFMKEDTFFQIPSFTWLPAPMIWNFWVFIVIK